MKKRATKKAISMSLAATMAFAPVQAFAASSDIVGHWAESAITSWQDKGLISGYEDGTFKPDNSITRAEFATMINKALGFTEKGEVSFSDVKEGDWYYDAISIAAKAGYCSGYTDGTFKPNATITRAEAAVMISLAKSLAKDETATSKFSDAANIPAWAKGYVGAVVSAGYMSGRPNGTFDGTNTITRAEAVSSIDRAMVVEETETNTDTETNTETETSTSTETSEETLTDQQILDMAVEELYKNEDFIKLNSEEGLTGNEKLKLPTSIRVADKYDVQIKWTFDDNGDYPVEVIQIDEFGNLTITSPNIEGYAEVNGIGLVGYKDILPTRCFTYTKVF